MVPKFFVKCERGGSVSDVCKCKAVNLRECVYGYIFRCVKLRYGAIKVLRYDITKYISSGLYVVYKTWLLLKIVHPGFVLQRCKYEYA